MPKSTPTPQVQVSKINDAPVKFYKTRKINEALEIAEPGDTVILEPGDYTSFDIFVPEDVYVLSKPGAILGYEFNNVNGFTRNISDLNAISGAQSSSDLGGPSGIIYYIRPLRGTAIKNSDPNATLAVEIHQIKDGQDNVVDSGDIKLFYQNPSGQYLPVDQLDPNSDGYFAEIGREDIDGSRELFVMDSSKPLTENNIFDSITLADIQDGHGFVGWVSVTPGFTASEEEDGTFSPSFIELDPNFTFDGQIINIQNDSAFTFTSVPSDEGGIDVFGPDNKVEVDTKEYFGSRDKKQFSANWEAEYVGPGGKTFTFQLVETVYKAEDGKSSQTLQIIAQSQAFKLNKDGNLSPDSIRLRASTQNISGIGIPGGAEINWTVEDTDPNGLSVTLRDAQGNPTTTGEEVFLEKQDIPDSYVNATIKASVDDQFVREPPVEDEIAVAKLVDGDPGFTIVLTNENHTFPVQGDGTITDQDYSNGATTANVWRGTNRFSYDQNLSQDGTWRFVPFSNDLNEVTPEGAIEVEVDGTTGRIVPDNMTFPSATVAVRIEVRYKNNTRDKFRRQISYSKAEPGNDVKRLQLSANSQVFKVFQDGTVDPDPDGPGGVTGKITLQALLANLDPFPDDEVLWTTEPSYVLGTDVAPGDDSRISSDGTEFELFYDDLKNTTGSSVDGVAAGEFTDQVAVTAEIEISGTTYSDQFTIFRLKEGSNAYTLALTNEAHAISTNVEGIPLANQDPNQRIPGAETDIRLFQGVQEITESSDTVIEIAATDDVAKLQQTFSTGSDQEVQTGDTLTLGGNAASPPEIYISDIDFPVEFGDNTASVDVRAKFTPNAETGQQIVGRKTWNISTAQKGNEGIQWVIKPLNGAAIKNSNPNKVLTFEAQKIIGETTITLEQIPTSPEPGIEPQVPETVDDLGIYVRNDVGGGEFEYIRACNAIFNASLGKFVPRSDTSGTQDCHPNQGSPLSPKLGTEQVQGQTTLYLLKADEDVNGVDEAEIVLKTNNSNGDNEVAAVLDELDVVDILDGLSGGFLEVTPSRVIQVVQTRPDGGGFVEPLNGTNLEPIGRFTKEGSTNITNSFGAEFDFSYDTSPGGSGGSNEIYVSGAALSSENQNAGAVTVDFIRFLDANGGTKEITSKSEIVNDAFGTGQNEREIAGFSAVRVSYTFTSPDTGQETTTEDTFPVRKEAGARYFIQPEGTGTAIKNKEGTVDLRAFKLQPNIEGREELDLYTIDGDGREFALVDENDNIVGDEVGSSFGGNDPFRLEFDTVAIDNDTDLSLKEVDSQGSPIGEILDSITVVDVTDGSDAVIASIQASTSGIDTSTGDLLDPGSDTTLGFTYDPNASEFDPPISDINSSGSDDYYLIATFFRQGNVIEHDGQKARAALRLKFDESQGVIRPDGADIPNIYTGSTVASNGEEYDIIVTTNDPNQLGTRSLRGRFAYSSTDFLENSFDLVEQVVVSQGGLDGSSAKVVTLEAPTLTFVEDSDGNVSPNSITLTAKAENLTNTSWEFFVNGSSVGSGFDNSDSSAKYTVQKSQLTNGTAEVKVEATDGPTNTVLQDSTTLVRLKDGSNAITPLLSNPSHTFQADSDGSVDSSEFSTGDNVLSVFEGTGLLNFVGTGTSFPSNGEFRVDASTSGMIQSINISDQGDTALIEVTGIDNSASVTQGSVSLTLYITKRNGDTVTFDQSISYTKSIAGPKGDKGDAGDVGPGVVYRGEYDSSKTYFDRTDPGRKDVVLDTSDGEYYLTDNKNKDGQSNWDDPSSGSDWAQYGQQFESVATDFLLAQDATITNTLTMGESGSDSGLIRSAVEPTSGSPLYEIGNTSQGEGILYRDSGGNTVFQALNSGDAQISNLNITGTLTIDGGEITNVDETYRIIPEGYNIFEGLDFTIDNAPGRGIIFRNSPKNNDLVGALYSSRRSAVTTGGSTSGPFRDIYLEARNPDSMDVVTVRIEAPDEVRQTVGGFKTRLDNSGIRFDGGSNVDSVFITDTGDLQIQNDNNNVEGQLQRKFGGGIRLESKIAELDIESDNGNVNIDASSEVVFGNSIFEMRVAGSDDGVLNWRKVFFNSSTPFTPSSGLNIYAKEDGGGFVRPVYNRENGDEFFIDSNTSTSDISIKSNIRKIDNVNDRLRGVEGYLFEKDTIGGEKTLGGVVAQQLKTAYPEAVIVKPSGEHQVDNLAIQGLLVEGWKNHDDRISELEDEVFND